MNIKKIQSVLKEYNLDGWLFTDFRGHDFITNEFLSLTERKCTRRLFYYIPVEGEPTKILSAIEPLLLDHLPGKLVLYKGITGQDSALRDLFHSGMKVACQYSPKGNVPVISSMDAGIVELLRGYNIELISSANIMQYFGAVLTDEQIESHRKAGVIIHRILDNTFKWIRQNISDGNIINEWMLLQEMKRLIANEPIHTDAPPFLGVDEHACDPGYEPKEIDSKEIKEGSRLIIDIDGRLPEEDAVVYDVTWCMNVGPCVDSEYQKLFDIVNGARDQALQLIQTKLNVGEMVKGCEVDAHLREYFKKYGLDKYIMHRTGHNIGHEGHGIGANLDDYETHDDRYLLPGTLFSVEPGIYTEKYGVRLEFDVHITKNRNIKIYGPIQKDILIV